MIHGFALPVGFRHRRPNVALGVFPAVMIPAFAVPSWTLLHALSLRQLRRKL